MTRLVIEESTPRVVISPDEAAGRVVLTADEDGLAQVVQAFEDMTTVVATPSVERVVLVEPPADVVQVVTTVDPAPTQVMLVPGSDQVVVTETVQRHVVIAEPEPGSGVQVVATSLKGPKGDPGPPGNGVASYTHVQAVPATVWTIEHGLDFDPAGIVVTTDDGYMADGFGVQYLVAGTSLRLSFDVAVAGTARLS